LHVVIEEMPDPRQPEGERPWAQLGTVRGIVSDSPTN
jgi:hypothetical protein